MLYYAVKAIQRSQRKKGWIENPSSITATTTATNKCSLNSIFWVQCPYHHSTLETQTDIVNSSIDNYHEEIIQNSKV